jgi:hypothetical protein
VGEIPKNYIKHIKNVMKTYMDVGNHHNTKGKGVQK